MGKDNDFMERRRRAAAKRAGIKMLEPRVKLLPPRIKVLDPLEFASGEDREPVARHPSPHGKTEKR
jgi:hypothetical protein